MGEGANEWARKHKKAFARKMIRDAEVSKSVSPTAIFMAGLPGAGKTEFTKNLIVNLGVRIIRLDMDEIASQIDTYEPQKADKFRAAASMLLSRTFDMVVHGGYDFIMDGTFAGNSATQNIERAVNHGYTVKIFYIHQDPLVAWKYTRAREKVEHRAIDRDGFVGSYYRTFDNLRKVGREFGARASMDIIIKNDKNGIKTIKNNVNVSDIDQYVIIEYNKDKLREQLHE